MQRLADRVAGVLFLAACFALGFQKYFMVGVYGPDTQWDLIVHLAAVQRVLGVRTDIDPATIQHAFLPPFLPAAFFVLAPLAGLAWAIAKLWGFLASLLLAAALFGRVLIQVRRARCTGAAGFALALCALVAFKGTCLGIAAGQMSILVAALLYFGFVLRDSSPMAAVALFGLGMLKPNMAAPMFVFLLYSGRYRLLCGSLLFAAVVNTVAAFTFLGPAEHLRLLREGLAQLPTVSLNDFMLKLESGRSDLAPLLAAMGMGRHAVEVLQIVIGAGLLAAVLAVRRRLSDEFLALVLNGVFFVALYHRSYDAILLLALAMPPICCMWRRFRWWQVLLCMPLVLPIETLGRTGLRLFPSCSVVFEVFGTSFVVAVATGAASLVWFHLHSSVNGAGIAGNAGLEGATGESESVPP